MAGDYYSRVSGRFWIDTKGWGDRNQLVALYLLTNTHRSMEGLYHLPLGYLCADLGLSPKQATEALRVVQDRNLIAYDEDAEVVFIRKALKHGAPKTENHIKGAIARLKSVPWSPLWHEFFMACECHSHGLAKAMRVEWPMAFESSSSSSSSNLKAGSPSDVGGCERDADRTERPKDLADEVVGILQRGIDGLTGDEPCKRPTRAAVIAALGDATELQAKAAAIEARSIAQSQNRAPNIVALFAQKLRESYPEGAAA